MSRHRDIRCMNYSDEYDGYDDVYGHSLEDDYCTSPSAEQFLFDRSKEQNIASFIIEPDILEDNEDIDESSSSFSKDKYNLSELEKAKLLSCIDIIKNVIGDTIPESKLKKKIILSNFNADVALDAILKESSPKNPIDPIVNKERGLEGHSDVSVDKSNMPMFTIPKFSFKKENLSLNNSSSASCYAISNSLNKSKDIKHSPTSLSSLAGLISDQTDSASSNTIKISSQNNADVQSFGSLAALTAHHLQKSDATNYTEFLKNSPSSSSQFVIPKLSIKKNDSEETTDTQLLKFRDNENRQTISINNIDKHSIGLLEADFSNMRIFPNSATKNINFENQTRSIINDVNQIRTPSPDNLVDLSIALKEAELLTRNISNADFALKKLDHEMANLEIHDDKNNIKPNLLPVTLNSCALRLTKLPYTKQKPSVFGRTLCRKWKTEKPNLKIFTQHCHTIKPFDFSTSYTRNTNRS